MVRVQSIVRVLLVAAVAMSATGVSAEDVETQTVAETVEKTCVAPEVVANFETKIDTLEAERAQWESQFVAANGQWKKEKNQLEEKLAQEQTLQKKYKKEVQQAQDEAAKAVAALEKIDTLEAERAQWESQLVAANGQWKKEKYELEEKLAQEQALQKKYQEEVKQAQVKANKAVAALEKQLSDSAAKHAETVEKLEKQVGAKENQHTQTLEQLKDQVAALEKNVAQLKTQVEEQKVTLGKRDAEVSEARAKLVKSQDQVKTLERDVASSRKKNEALRDELQKLDEKLTISALLSSYYDEGVVLASNAVTALRLQIESAQQGSTGVTQALEALETYKKTVSETTSALYAEHLAATLDPLIADLRRASDPYVKQYQPIVEAEFTNAKKIAIKNYNLAFHRATAARTEAITLLQQTEGVAPYAQQIVDGSLIVLVAPIAYLLLRLVLSLVWFLVSTTFCVLTLGWCCGLCARKRSKSKRKGSRKPLSPSPSPGTPPPPASKKSTNTQPTNNGKRAGGKKK